MLLGFACLYMFMLYMCALCDKSMCMFPEHLFSSRHSNFSCFGICLEHLKFSDWTRAGKSTQQELQIAGKASFKQNAVIQTAIFKLM